MIALAAALTATRDHHAAAFASVRQLQPGEAWWTDLPLDEVETTETPFQQALRITYTTRRPDFTCATRADADALADATEARCGVRPVVERWGSAWGVRAPG